MLPPVPLYILGHIRQCSLFNLSCSDNCVGGSLLICNLPITSRLSLFHIIILYLDTFSAKFLFNSLTILISCLFFPLLIFRGSLCHPDSSSSSVFCTAGVVQDYSQSQSATIFMTQVCPLAKKIITAWLVDCWPSPIKYGEGSMQDPHPRIQVLSPISCVQFCPNCKLPRAGTRVIKNGKD